MVGPSVLCIVGYFGWLYYGAHNLDMAYYGLKKENIQGLVMDLRRDGGGSLKALHRLIVTSATYRQSSKVTPEMLAKDAENTLFARFPRTRLEAEISRAQIWQWTKYGVKLEGGIACTPRSDTMMVFLA